MGTDGIWNAENERGERFGKYRFKSLIRDHAQESAQKRVGAITEEKISFGSVLVARYWDKDKRAVFPYLLTNNVSKIKKKLENMGYTLLNPMDWYMDQLPKDE